MRRWTTYLTLFGMAVSALVIGAPPKTANTGRIAAVVDGQNRFAFDLYKHIGQLDGNLFFSPYSISTALSMTSSGAKGETANQMLHVLNSQIGALPLLADLNNQLTHVQAPGNPVPQLLIANAIWVQKGFPLLPAFSNSMRNDFMAGIEYLDFANDASQASNTINKWVENQTRGKIAHLFSPQDLSKNTRLVLTSAIYMKAQWLHLFEETMTTKKPFFQKQASSPVDMMNTTASFPLYVDRNFAAIELPYANQTPEGPRLNMVIILPKDRNGLAQIEKDLALGRWSSWLGQMKMRLVDLSLPKFKIEQRTELTELLEVMGMKLAFTPQANFSGISGHPDLYISKVIHQTFINVDEKGTEAAVATGVVMNLTSFHEEDLPYAFVADHPFWFAIYDSSTKAIIFMGRVTQPEEKM